MPAEPKNRAHWIGEALERYQRPLVRYALRFTGDLERARDVVQESFLKLCQADPARVREHLGAWLYTVCRNQALSARRKESRMTPLGEVETKDVSSSAGPEELLEAGEQVRRVLEELARLPENQQEVVRLKFQEGLRYREISRVTGLSVSNVGFLLHTALKTIRGRVGREQPRTSSTLRRIK